MECTVKSKKVGREITVDYDFGANLEEAIEKFGPQAVHNHFVASAKLSVNSLVRPMLEAGFEFDEATGAVIGGEPANTDEAIHTVVSTYKIPDKTGRSGGGTAALITKLKGMSAEKRAEILALLQED